MTLESTADAPTNSSASKAQETAGAADSAPQQNESIPMTKTNTADAKTDSLPNNAQEISSPVPSSQAPPLPDEAPPEDDGWEYAWDDNEKRIYYWNRFTKASQWENPRVPEANVDLTAAHDNNTSRGAPGTSSSPVRRYGGYNPAIHGSYDPKADYAIQAQKEEEEEEAAAAAAALPAVDPYVSSAFFNRFTGKYQNPSINPDNHNDENKARRQMSAFFDVDAAANSHDGRSLKAERQGKRLTKQELKAFKEKRREKKEEKRRAWLRD